MKKIIILGIVVLAIPVAVCFAQNNETLTLCTYYPSPYGVYKTVRLVPANALVPDGDCDREGETSYYANMHQVYICKGPSPFKWKLLGAAKKVQTGYASPGTCSTGADALGLCQTIFYEDIVFSEPFSAIPKVIVLPALIPDPAYAPLCSKNETDRVISYPENSTISATGFRLFASGSPTIDGTCGAKESWLMRARVKWLAIVE